jgi:multiple sugar transport system permease protein
MNHLTPQPSPRKGFHQLLAALPFMAPNLLGVLVFTLVPVFISAALSLTDWNLQTSPRFVGIENYRRLLGFSRADGAWMANDPDFWRYLWNTLYLMLAIPLSMAGSLFLAVLLNRRIPGRTLLRSIYFLPSMCLPVAVFMLWRWIYNPDAGLLNWGIAKLGLSPPDWLTDAHWAKPALMLAGLWAGIGGYNMILYLAALQNISPSMHEAAVIDGAGPWNNFWHVTFPQLAPTTFFIGIISIIGGLQGGFDAAKIMTDGGPAGSTTTLIYYIYNNAFEFQKMGYAAAISWVMFMIIMFITLTTWKYGKTHDL